MVSASSLMESDSGLWTSCFVIGQALPHTRKRCDIGLCNSSHNSRAKSKACTFAAVYQHISDNFSSIPQKLLGLFFLFLSSRLILDGANETEIEPEFLRLSRLHLHFRSSEVHSSGPSASLSSPESVSATKRAITNGPYPSRSSVPRQQYGINAGRRGPPN